MLRIANVFEMRNILILFITMISAAATAQITEKNVEVSNKYYELLRIVKQNPAFEFIAVPKQMTHVYNGQELSYGKINAKDYVMRIYPNNDITIHQKVTDDKHYLSVINKTIVGYSLITEHKTKVVIVKYYNGSKTVYDNEIKAN